MKYQQKQSSSTSTGFIITFSMNNSNLKKKKFEPFHFNANNIQGKEKNFFVSF